MTDPDQTNPSTPLMEKASTPIRARPVTWWWLVSALTISLILAAASIILIRDLARVITLLVLAVSIANALAPAANWLGKRLHIPRVVAVLLVYLLLVLVFLGILWLVVPVLVKQVESLARQVPGWIPRIADWFSQFGLDPSSLVGSLSSITSQVGGSLISLPVAFFSSLFDLVLIVFISLYWLILMNNILGFALSFFPEEKQPGVQQVLRQVGSAMGGYLRGSAINGILYGTAKYIGLTIIGVPFALTMGIIAALFEFFPVIGAILSGAIAVLVAFSVSPTTALITLVFILVLQQLENNLLVPLVMRSQTHVSPLLSITAIVAGGAVGGILGAVVAIPIVSALDVLVRMVIAPALRRANGVPAENDLSAPEAVTEPEQEAN